jgi:hypothetical protein
MGFLPSPYYSTRFYYWAEELGQGDRREKLNPLQWDKVPLNFPGDKKFDPTLPMVMKWDLEIDNIAGDVSTFVDDLRASGCDEEVIWRISRQISSRLQYLGIQDAPRKRHPLTRKTGAWGGYLLHFRRKDHPNGVARKMGEGKGPDSGIVRATQEGPRFYRMCVEKSVIPKMTLASFRDRPQEQYMGGNPSSNAIHFR